MPEGRFLARDDLHAAPLRAAAEPPRSPERNRLPSRRGADSGRRLQWNVGQLVKPLAIGVSTVFTVAQTAMAC